MSLPVLVCAVAGAIYLPIEAAKRRHPLLAGWPVVPTLRLAKWGSSWLRINMRSAIILLDWTASE